MKINLSNIVETSSGWINKNLVTIGVIAALIIIGGAIIYFKPGEKKPALEVISAQDAGQKVVNYINNNLLKDAPDKVSFKDASEISGVYKVTFSYQGADNEVYVTADGKLMFPAMQGVPVNIDQAPANPSSNTGTPKKTCEELKKADKSSLDAFVVSNCPYGLQMQRILAEVIKNIPTFAQNIKVRYIGEVSGDKITSMHGDTEAQENLRQICLREETDKYWSYVNCYLKKGETSACLASTGVNTTNLSACMSDASRGIKYAKADFDLASQLGVGGSPTLILNGETADEFSFGGRTADALKTLICCGSNEQSAICTTALSKDSAATSFSETYAGSGSGSTNDASCGQ